MAEKDLGALIVRIQADVSQLKTAIANVKVLGETATQTQTKVKTLQDRFGGLAGAIPPVIASFFSLRTIMKIDDKFSKEVKIQEEAIARLGSALRSTNGIAGLTIDDFQKMGEVLQETSAHTLAEITNTQSIIAAFTNIRGKVFQDTMQTILNLSDAFEMDLTQVARSVGKALQNPTKGMLSLQRIGLGLTPVVMSNVKAFMKVNDVLSAQGEILAFLKTRLDFTSQMLAETMPGALQQTQNAWDNLFRVGGTAGVERYRDSLLKLRDSLKTEEMKNFFDTLGSGWYTIKAGLVYLASLAVHFKELIVIATITGMLMTLAATIKMAVIPALHAFGIAVTASFGPIGPAVLLAIELVSGLVLAIKSARAELNGLPGGTSMSGNNINIPVPKEAKVKKVELPWDLKTPEAIEGMQEEAEMTQLAMDHLMNKIKYGGMSAKKVLQDINAELKNFPNKGLVKISGIEQYDQSYLVLQNTKNLLETMTGKTMKGFAKASKEAFTDVVSNVKNQIEFLGTSGASFLPGLEGMLSQFPVLSANWVTLKQLIISIEKDIADVQISNARIVREAREKEEEELSKKAQEAIKKQQAQWQKLASFNKLGFLPDDTLLQNYQEEYERLLDIYKTDISQYITWPDELIEAYERVNTVLLDKVQPTMDYLKSQYENGNLSVDMYRQSLENLASQYSNMPGIVQAITTAMTALDQSILASTKSMGSFVREAETALRDKLVSLPDSLSDAFSNAIVYSENLGEALKKLAQEIVFATLKAAILKAIMGGFGGGTATSFVPVPGVIGAKGLVFDSGQLTPFARGGIVDHPTIFPFAKGTGLMGEAGPEAIMPLKRGPDGSLGVAGGSNGGGDNVTVNMTVNAMDSKSVVDMLTSNKGTIESLIVSTFRRNGALRSAIRQGA